MASAPKCCQFCKVILNEINSKNFDIISEIVKADHERTIFILRSIIQSNYIISKCQCRNSINVYKVISARLEEVIDFLNRESGMIKMKNGIKIVEATTDYCVFCTASFSGTGMFEDDSDMLSELLVFEDNQILDVINIIMKIDFIFDECTCCNGNKIIKFLKFRLEKMVDRLEKEDSKMIINIKEMEEDLKKIYKKYIKSE